MEPDPEGLEHLISIKSLKYERFKKWSHAHGSLLKSMQNSGKYDVAKMERIAKDITKTMIEYTETSLFKYPFKEEEEVSEDEVKLVHYYMNSQGYITKLDNGELYIQLELSGYFHS